MGFFDLATPLLDVVDSVLSFMNHGWRLVVWSLIGSLLSMGLYALFSRQEAMAELKPKIAAARNEMANFDGELDEMWPLMKRQLGLSFKQLGMALGPALLASIPLIFVLVWLSNRFDLIPPEPGDRIPVSVAEGEIFAPELRTLADGSMRLTWAESGISLREPDGSLLVELSGEQISPMLHKREWWNALIANPAGYLPADANANWVMLEFQTRQYLPFGPSWLRGWEASFLGLLLIFSLILKFWWKLH